MKKFLTLLMLLALAIPAWAGEQTITITRNDEFVTGHGDFTIRKGGVTVTIGGTLNNPHFIQLSQQKTITFRSANFAIKEIIFHCLDNYTEYVQDDVFYWGPSTMHVIKNTALGTIPGKYTPLPNNTSYDPNSTYDGIWVSKFSGTWTTAAGTHTSYADGFPAGNTLTFEASAKPVRFSSIDIVIEKESGDIYELVRNTSQIQTGINYMLVGRANNTTMTGRALSIYNTDPNNPSTGNIKSTYVDLLDNGLRVRANDSVQFIHLGDALSHGNNATSTGAQDYKWYIQTDAQNSIRTGSSTTTGDNATANYNKGYQLLKESTPSSTASGRWRFYTSFNINGSENSADNYDNNVVIKFFTGYGGGSNYEYSNQQIRHNNDYGVFRNITDNTSTRQKVYLYQPATSYKVKAEVGTGASTGTVSLRDGVILNNNVYWSQMSENVSFMANAADGYKVSGITIQKTDENFNVLAGEEMINIKNSVTTTNGTLYFFEMPASHVLITVNYEPVTYRNVYIEVKPNVNYGNVFLTQGYVVQQNQVKSYEGQNVVFSIIANPKDPDNENSALYELYSVTVTYNEGGQEISYTYTDGNYNFTMPDADVTITATFIYDNGNPLYLLGTANGKEFLPYGPRFNYDTNNQEYYIDVYFKGANEFGGNTDDAYGYFCICWGKYSTWDEVNSNTRRGQPYDSNFLITTQNPQYTLCYDDNRQNSFKIPAGIYRIKVKSYGYHNDVLSIERTYPKLTLDPMGSETAETAPMVSDGTEVMMTGDIYNKIMAINPDEPAVNFKYKAVKNGTADAPVPSTTTATTTLNKEANQDETTIELNGYNYLGWIVAGDTAYYKVIETPLSWIEDKGTPGKDYIVADQLVIVHIINRADEGHPEQRLIWAKDQGNRSICPTAIIDGQKDYMREVLNMQPGPWDQSNWVMLKFPNGTDLEDDDHDYNIGQTIKAGTLKGRYVDDVNYCIEVESMEIDGSTEYNPNVYCPVNFLDKNLNLNDAPGQATGGSGTNYFFMNPKVQEVADVIVAVWTGSGFVVPASTGGQNSANLDGAFTVAWDYNLKYDVHSDLVVGQAYVFRGVLNLKSSKLVQGKDDVTPDSNKNVMPFNLDDSTITAIQDIEEGKTVSNVKYYNITGMESDKPFSGVNIVVTRYTDGSFSTSKVLR